MKIYKYIMNANLFTLVCAMSGLSGCVVEDFSFEDHYYNTIEQLYEKQFSDSFGEIDPEHDWSTAMEVVGSVDGSSVEDAVSVSVYTAKPSTSGAKLLSRNVLNNSEFHFDAPKGTENVYVVLNDEKGRAVFSDYFPVQNGRLNVGMTTRATRADGCPVSLGTMRTRDQLGYFKDADVLYNTSLHYNYPYDDRIYYDQLAPYYMLEGVEKSAAATWMVRDLYDIIGKGGPFFEKGVDADGYCNLSKWFSELNVDKGVEFILRSDGPVEFDYFYGVTANGLQLGYYYFSESDAGKKDKITTRPRYVLCDASPTANFKVDGQSITGGQDLYTQVLQRCEYEDGKDSFNKLITGSHYKLAYFGEDGKGAASYTFPQGTHIVFFIVTQGQTRTNDWGNYVEHSVPLYNYWEYKRFDESKHTKSPAYASYNAATQGEICAVTYKWADQIIVGFEDDHHYDDDDMNDVMLLINGHFQNIIPDVYEYYFESTETPLNECVIAYEDMGAVGDFDFNDVVIGIAKDPSDANSAFVYLKAAGGTLETYVTYDFENNGEYSPLTFYENNPRISTAGEEGTEVHAAYYVDQKVMVNTGVNHTHLKPVAKINVEDGWAVTSQAHRFAIRVVTNEKEYKEIHIPNKNLTGEQAKVPQAILVGSGDWEWPSENENISIKYPDFVDWVSDHLNTSWADASWGSNIETSAPIALIPASLNVSLSNLSLTVGGEDSKLNIETNSAGALTVTSQSDNVATIVLGDDGNYYVHPVAEGAARITVSVAATSSYSAVSKTLTVNVTAASSDNSQGLGSAKTEFTEAEMRTMPNYGNIKYLINVADLPTSGKVTIKFLYENSTYVNAAALFSETWDVVSNKHWHHFNEKKMSVDLSPNKVSIDGGKHFVAKFTINAEDYAGANYLIYVGYSDSKVYKVIVE